MPKAKPVRRPVRKSHTPVKSARRSLAPRHQGREGVSLSAADSLKLAAYLSAPVPEPTPTMLDALDAYSRLVQG